MPQPKITIKLDDHWRREMEGKTIAENVKTQSDAVEGPTIVEQK